MGNMTNQAIVAYVPVLHQGFLQFFAKYPQAKVIFLVDRMVLTELVPSLRKDMRALPAEQMHIALASLGKLGALGAPAEAGSPAPGCEVKVLTTVDELAVFDELILPNDEAMRAYAEQYLADKTIHFDSVFLRWDTQQTLAEKSVEPDVEISNDELDQQLMAKASALTNYSADWWRQVGGVVAKNGEVLLSAYNRHLPTEHEPHYHGDPRANFQKGVHIELSTAIHVEQQLIAEAARRGISLEGTDLYVTTFPCPVCAKSVAISGIKRVFYADGYSMVDGAELMKSKGIEIVKVG